MGRRKLSWNRFGFVKTHMGLELFEVRIFFSEKITKIDLVLKEVITNRSKVV